MADVHRVAFRRSFDGLNAYRLRPAPCFCAKQKPISPLAEAARHSRRMRQDLLTRNPSVAGALRLPATEETPEIQGIFGSRRFANESRWESLGKRQVSKGGRSRSCYVVSGDGRRGETGLNGIGVRGRLASVPLRARLPRRRRAPWSAMRDLRSAQRFKAVGRRVSATARIAALTDRPAVRSPLSVLRSEKSCGAFVPAGIALMIAVG